MKRGVFYSFLMGLILFGTNLSFSATINVPGDSATIQAGINGASEGDTILVDEGIYYENLDINTPSLVLASKFLTTGDSSYIINTIIDGSHLTLGDSLGSVIKITPPPTGPVSVIGFTIQNGKGLFSGGSLPYFGRAGGGIFVEDSKAFIAHNVIKNNHLESNYSKGGGIAASGHGVVIYKNEIVDNELIGYNYEYGSGIYSQDDSCILIRANVVKNNIPNGIMNFDFPAKIDSNIITGHSDNGIWCQSQIEIRDNIITHNDNNGIAANYAYPIITGNLIAYNGRGIASRASAMEIEDNTIINNHSTGPGGALYKYWYNTVTLNMSNNIVWNNTSEDDGPQINLEEAATLNLYNNDVQNGVDDIFIGSDVTVNWVEGNIELDPMFCDTVNDNYHIAFNSPCAPDNNLSGDLIGAFEIGCGANLTTITPDVMSAMDAHIYGVVYASTNIFNIEDGYDIYDINTSSLLINGSISPVDFEYQTIDSLGEVLSMSFSESDFVMGYMPLWDTTMETYTITGQFNDNTDFSTFGWVKMIGHRSGDANGDGLINIFDISYLVSYLYLDGPPPVTRQIADVNCDTIVNIFDISYLISYLYLDGPEPVCP